MTYGWDGRSSRNAARLPVRGEGKVDLSTSLRNEAGIRLVAALESRDVSGYSPRGRGQGRNATCQLQVPVTGRSVGGDRRHARRSSMADITKRMLGSRPPATAPTRMLVQITQLFDAGRCGDVVISSVPDGT